MYCLIALSALTAQLSRVPLVGNQLVNDRLTPMAEEGMGLRRSDVGELVGGLCGGRIFLLRCFEHLAGDLVDGIGILLSQVDVDEGIHGGPQLPNPSVLQVRGQASGNLG